jgi:cold shock CspA family protein
MSARVTGTVQWWSAAKGFGFARVEGRDGDVFVGSKACEAAGGPEPQVGDRLTFTIGADSQGRPRAEDIRGEAADTVARKVFEPVRP